MSQLIDVANNDAEEIVLNWIIDDGDSSREHRNTLFSTYF